ncbi:lamin tail domain-containing protein [Candidatus Woesearchaeota archaeon]|nr:lamin tail domain-containing protein [Candidatus Woesearchaeota archaeon]
MKKLILIFLLIPEVSALIVTEFMPNPEGPDEDLEWVELYNSFNYSINLENFFLNGKKLQSINLNPEETLIIARQLLDKDNNNFSFEKQYGNKNNILDEEFKIIESSFTLKNGEGTINLTNLSYTIFISYGKSQEGFSFVKNDLNSEFIISNIKNGEPGKFTPEIKENPIPNTNQSQPIKLEITEFMPNPEGPDDDKPPNGEWILIKNNGELIETDGFYFEDNSNGRLLISHTNVDGNTLLQSGAILKVYRAAQDFSLNNNGDVLKLKSKDNQLIDLVSYTHSTEGISWIKLNSSWVLNENFEAEEKETENYIKIEKIYGKTNFDSLVYIKLNIYYKNSINGENDIVLHIENLTEKIKLQLYSKNINYSMLFPIKIPSNCNNNFNEGNYLITASGISTFDKKRIFVESDEKCQEVIKTALKEKTDEAAIKTTTTTISLPEKPELNEEKENIINEKKPVYAAKETQIRSYAVVLFVALLILIAGAIIYGRWENTHKDNLGSSWSSKRSRRKNYRYDFGEYKED